MVGKKRAGGAIALPDTEDHVRGDSGVGLVTTQPTRKDTPRYQALLSAVEAGAIPASALDEDDEDEDVGPTGDERDDERTGTRYNVSTDVHHFSLLLMASFAVLMVSYHLCYGKHVRRHAPYRLVCSSHSLPLCFSYPPRRNVVSTRPLPDSGTPDPNQDVYIGRSETAMWMRVVSSWVCILLYIWSLVAPVFMPDR